MTGVQTCALPIFVLASHEPNLVNALGARVVRLGEAAEASESQAEPELGL